jgi:hypothetical protein
MYILKIGAVKFMFISFFRLSGHLETFFECAAKIAGASRSQEVPHFAEYKNTCSYYITFYR